jgi:hypothetical protein
MSETTRVSKAELEIIIANRMSHDTVRNIARELLALRKVGEWQDISTAPKDGTWIEAWRPPSTVGTSASLVFVRWHQFEDGDAAWVWPDDTYEVFTEDGRYEAERMIDRGDIYEDTKFTHWRDLPQPPSGTEL